MRELEGRIPDEIINLKGKDDADLKYFVIQIKNWFQFGSSPQILLDCLELQLFLITDFAIFKPEIFFESGKE